MEIDLQGDLAGILTLAGKKNRPLDRNDQSAQQVKAVEGLATTLTCSSMRPDSEHISAFAGLERPLASASVVSAVRVLGH